MKEILEALKACDPQMDYAKKVRHNLIQFVEALIQLEGDESAGRVEVQKKDLEVEEDLEDLFGGEPALVDEHLRYLTENPWRHIRHLIADMGATFQRHAEEVAGDWRGLWPLAKSTARGYGSLAVICLLAPFGTRLADFRRRRLVGVLAFVESGVA